MKAPRLHRSEGSRKGKPQRRPYVKKGGGKPLHTAKPSMADVIKGAAANQRKKY